MVAKALLVFEGGGERGGCCCCCCCCCGDGGGGGAFLLCHGALVVSSCVCVCSVVWDQEERKEKEISAVGLVGEDGACELLCLWLPVVDMRNVMQ